MIRNREKSEKWARSISEKERVNGGDESKTYTGWMFSVLLILSSFKMGDFFLKLLFFSFSDDLIIFLIFISKVWRNVFLKQKFRVCGNCQRWNSNERNNALNSF